MSCCKCDADYDDANMHNVMLGDRQVKICSECYCSVLVQYFKDDEFPFPYQKMSQLFHKLAEYLSHMAAQPFAALAVEKLMEVRKTALASLLVGPITIDAAYKICRRPKAEQQKIVEQNPIVVLEQINRELDLNSSVK